MGAARVRRVLAATDLSRYGNRAVGRAVRLARQHGARVTVLCVAYPQADADLLEQVRTRLAGLLRQYADGPEVDIGVRVGRVSPTITEERRRTGADLLAVGAHGAHRPADALLGTTPENLVRSSRVPVLVVRLPPHDDYRTVMLAVDVTESSRAAAAYGLALTPGAEHYAVHVCAVPGEHLLRIRGVGEERLAELRRAYLAEVRPDAERLVRSLAPLPPRLLVSTGAPATAVPELAGLHGADLVVLGTGARSKLEHAFLGSVAQHVMRRAPCDVLVVREGTG
ncbi:universal stress protein [Streptomyces sp. CC228A]|uniref:universal stress protein n=1 Tax=Streptomyces sp. CC228A TaxID=2898186 RepID=UPI001F43E806|nr:universal stress protein [Streptomyces sp. CC228A]